MKTFKILILSFIFLSGCLFFPSGFAQTKKATKAVEVKIKVNFNCTEGKTLIEKELKKEAGVAKVVADVKTKTVTVSFDGTKTNREKIYLAIEKIGYTTEFTPEGKKINRACTHDVENKTEEPKNK